MALQALGIDARVAAVLEAQGVHDLYPPQKEAWQAIRSGRNALVAIPTASGKSLVAYLALLHRWLATGGKALYIVPLRALAAEKHEELLAFRALGLTVGLATGDLDAEDARLGRFDVIVCTSEKADALLRHRTPWLADIGCVVADELHLLHDPGRGPTLEVILTRFRSLHPKTQIVGLSATVANAKELAHWLDAALVTSDWRPVKLRTGTYDGEAIEFLGEAPRPLAARGDGVASLVEDTLREGGQCLVFVSTRRSAESQAQRLGGLVRGLLRPEELAALEEAVRGLDDAGEGSPTGKKLAKLCAAGVAFHTAGLDAAQRRFVEREFRARRLKVLCATPTLAAGVNTPARRVIVRDLTRFEAGEGSRPLPVMEVKQMMGRAGRPRYDPHGEAVLVVKDGRMKEAAEEEYLRGHPEAVASKLGADAALRTHVLASVAGGYARSRADLEAFLRHTFWAEEVEAWLLRDRLDDTLTFLEESGFTEADGDSLRATLFGRRTSDLCIDPLSALRLREALSSAAEPTPFGLLQAVAGCPDVRPLYLRASDSWLEARVVQHWDEFLVAADANLLRLGGREDKEEVLSWAKTACLLLDWVEEKHQDLLEEVYDAAPGDLHARREAASWLTHALRELARTLRPEWQPMLTDLGLRLEHGIQAELLPLVRLRGVGRVRARTLHRSGLRTPADLKGAPLSRLTALPGIGEALARDLLRQAGGDPDAAPPQPAAEPPQRGKGQSSVLDFGGRA